ncbi:snRNA-activating protein complex subunit 3-like isoform X2 [Schistocerca gregaria]|uniref:snRNA-activating protein complex subunit 3-like isoform X2 n=1 Tax=Schistocerca gregaria TaxID=7010 RepID=UPI00211EDC9F|nr:snRNA-activating protein complex subunit 3-like isoform X2 [Schistocerca gregaria]XP_049847896.1 snRNA-activating protein complex subunit 3-like isoform X2 [Schistocerca gregaria]XP_049847897.1 snRNA-activating protein complex subunit 3-like isoform X2 [Schistocerca gregaria]
MNLQVKGDRVDGMTCVVGAGVSGPSPAHSLIDVWKFKRAVSTIKELDREQFGCSTEDISSADIRCEDERYVPPHVAIANAIAAALPDPLCQQLTTADLVSTAPIPCYQDLMEKERKSNLESMKHVQYIRRKYPKYRNAEVNYLTKESVEEESTNISENEVVMNVVLYHPKRDLKAQEYLVLGSQYLTELKDKFSCSAGQFSEEVGSNGFFFIEDCFYSDTRFSGGIDCATPIRRWMESGESSYWSLRLIQSKKMESTKFEDLQIEINKRYLYCHGNCCEHHISFTVLRALSGNDRIGVYPKQVFQSKVRQNKCLVCNRFCAKYVTFSDSFAQEDPFYYCEHCFRAAHYDPEGRLIHRDFKVLALCDREK